MYSTDNYHYNTIPLSVSINQYLSLSNRISLVAEAEFQYLFTYSQHYHHFGNERIYRTSNVDVLGYGLNAYIGLRKKYKHFYIQPQFIFPVYQSLKSDRVFMEDENLRMNKWLKGGGIALSLGRYF
jgi:hypothetical protein